MKSSKLSAAAVACAAHVAKVKLDIVCGGGGEPLVRISISASTSKVNSERDPARQTLVTAFCCPECNFLTRNSSPQNPASTNPAISLDEHGATIIIQKDSIGWADMSRSQARTRQVRMHV